MNLKIIFLTYLITITAWAQESSQNLEISTNKTSCLIFPVAIKSIDRGSQHLLTQKATGVENVLLLKAGQTDFEETSLTVITADGSLFQFVINYAAHPTTLRYEIRPPEIKPVSFTHGLSETNLQQIMRRIRRSPITLRFHDTKKFKLRLALQGVYVHKEFLFCRLQVQNNSNIAYDLESFRMFIRDKSRLKRTAAQELPLQPLFQDGNLTRVPGKSSSEIILAFDTFTIPDAKRLHIELLEHNGGRHLTLIVKNRTIIRASEIPSNP